MDICIYINVIFPSILGDVTRHETGHDDNFSQCGDLFRKVLTVAERERLTDNIAGNLVNAKEFLQKRAVANFAAADANYGKMIQLKLTKLKALKKGKSSSSSARPLNPPRTKSNL
jgi:catalase